MKKWISKYWILLFFILIFVFMAVFRISFRDIWKMVSSLKAWQITVLLAMYFLTSFFSILIRKYLLFLLRFSSGFKNLTMIHFSTMAAHYSTPAKIGFPLTVYLLKKFENIPYVYGSSVILIELAVSMGLCGLFGLAGSIYYLNNYDLLQTFSCLAVFCPAVFFILKRVLKKTATAKLHSLATSIREIFSHITLRNLILYAMVAAFLQIFNCLNLVFLAFFFSYKLSVLQSLTASCSAFFMGAISMIPMGLGTRDVSMLFYLKEFGISSEALVSIITIQRLLSTGLSFVLGALFGTVLGIKNIYNHQEES